MWTVAVIDRNRFNRDCFASAFHAGLPGTNVVRYASAQQLLEAKLTSLAMIIYGARGAEEVQDFDLIEVSRLRAGLPSSPVVVLSDKAKTDDPRAVQRMLGAGALAVVPRRTSGVALLLAVIQLVQAGGRFAPGDVVLGGQGKDVRLPGQAGRAPGVLTPRQIDVLGHLARGQPNRAIALDLGMSESTVKVHVRNIMARLNATNRTQAAYKARELWAEVNRQEDLRS